MEDSFDNSMKMRRQIGPDGPNRYDDNTFSIPANCIAMHCPAASVWHSTSVSSSGSASIPSLLNSNTGNYNAQNAALSTLPTSTSTHSQTMTAALSPVSATNRCSPYMSAILVGRSSSLGEHGLKAPSPQELSGYCPDHSSSVYEQRRKSNTFERNHSCEKTSHAYKQPTPFQSNTKKRVERCKKHQVPVAPVSSLPASTVTASVQLLYRRSSFGEMHFQIDEAESDISNGIGKLEDTVMIQTALGRRRSQVGAEPAIQRERNRMAATKCRAKTKAAITKLEEVERAVSDRRENLSAERSALLNEVLFLRLELIKHSNCPIDSNIRNYLQNAATMIGQTGGTHRIWGPDGGGKLWPVDHSHQDT